MLEVGGQQVEFMLPEGPIVRQPVEGVLHGTGREARMAHPTAPLHVGEPGPGQHADVLGDGRKRHREALGELADAALTNGEASEDGAPRRVGERCKCGVEGIGWVNHMV